MAKYRSAVVIGRFQIFHNEHKQIFDEALALADQVIIVLGSHLAALDFRNPFTTDQREEMIRQVYPNANLKFVVVLDRYYNDSLWIQDVMYRVKEVAPDPRSVVLCGYYKDSTSYYLNYFRETWHFEAHISKSKLSATELRRNFFHWENVDFEKLKRQVPDSVYTYLVDYKERNHAKYTHFVKEHKYISEYRRKIQPEGYPYPIQLVTVDNVVVQKGHVLMVVRKAMPGKDLWAFPGGFVKPKESLFNAALRELKEETSLNVHKNILRRQLKDEKVFDHPERDLRARIITHGFYYELDFPELPQVKGGDDASKAFWVPWDDIIRYSDRVYTDHVHILSYFLNRSR